MTHNEAIRVLNAIAQRSSLERGLEASPAPPSDGYRYIVATSAAGAWSWQDLEIGANQDGAGIVYAPVKGWLAWVEDQALLAVRAGSDWVEAGPGGDGIFDTVRISATAYANQRLTLMSPASLFDHEGNGHQHKINKAADNDTASLLFQTGYSGRAEFGTTGDDDFHVKVSPDDSGWSEALIVKNATDNVVFPNTAIIPGGGFLIKGDFDSNQRYTQEPIDSACDKSRLDFARSDINVNSQGHGKPILDEMEKGK